MSFGTRAKRFSSKKLHAGQSLVRGPWPGPFLPLAGGLFEKTLVGFGLDVLVEGGPLGFVDQVDELFEVDRFVEATLGFREDVAEDAGLLGERTENVGVGVDEGRATGVAERGPVALFWEHDGPFVGHLEEEEEGDLLDVVAIIDAVVPEVWQNPQSF